LEYFHATNVVVVVRVYGGVQRTGVNDRDHGPTRPLGSAPGRARSNGDRFGLVLQRQLSPRSGAEPETGFDRFSCDLGDRYAPAPRSRPSAAARRSGRLIVVRRIHA
jgi:hypothetical protein